MLPGCTMPCATLLEECCLVSRRLIASALSIECVCIQAGKAFLGAAALIGQGQCAGTSLTYAEWAPLAPFTDSGLIRACTYFLNTQDFRMLACDTLKQLSHRRQDKVICTCLCTSQPVCACCGHVTAAVAGCISPSSAA